MRGMPDQFFRGSAIQIGIWGILNPDHIAENYWHLHSQPRDAWTFELDLRPYTERW